MGEPLYKPLLTASLQVKNAHDVAESKKWEEKESSKADNNALFLQRF